MDIVKLAISKPVGVAVGVILLVMFGLIGLGAIPVQLAPDVDLPIITVTTQWPGRSPEEVVDKIAKEQEEQLKNVGNLKAMRSVSREGACEVSLEFYVGSDVGRALQEVSDSLRRVPDLPDEADEPVIKAAEGASENAIAWIIIDLPPDVQAAHPDFDLTTLFDALDKEVKPYLERIGGVAEVNIYGARKREARVMTDAAALARHGLTYADVVEALRAENENTSAGTISEGKREQRIRVVGRFETAEQVLSTVVAYRGGSPIYVRDLGEVEIGHVKKRGFVRSVAGPAIAMNVIRQSNANVMDIMADLRLRLDEVRAEILPNLHPVAGPHLRLTQVYDETQYITSAIGLVVENIWVGGALAAIALLLFLRSFITTGIIAITIPLSTIGAFLVMLAMGRTLNVISLAGLAFAVGVGIDNAIVVLENTYRRLQLGDTPHVAAYRGANEVWSAILASTLTNIAVFIPVLTLQDETGQLFRDISLAIAASTVFSLIVSILVIPPCCARFLRSHEGESASRLKLAWRSLFGLAPLCASLNRRLSRTIYWLMTGWRAWTLRPAIVVVMTVLSLVGSYHLAPPMDYLPAGNRNLVFGGLLIPPGYSIEQQTSIAQRIEAGVGPYIHADPNDRAAVAQLPPIPRMGPPGTPPYDPVPIDNFFIGSFDGGMFCGATSAWEQVVIPVGQALTNAMMEIPDAYGGARQTSLFGRGITGGNSISIEISGPDLARVNRAAGMMLGTVGQAYGFQNVQPNPANFNLAQPEWRLRLNELGREMGLRTRDIGLAARALFDGAFVGDFSLNGDNIDLSVVPPGGGLGYKELLSSTPIILPNGRTAPIDMVVDVVPSTAPQAIQRIEELPAVALQLRPPVDKPLEQVMQDLRDNVIAPAQASGLIDRTMRVRLEGSAAQLDQVKSALFGASTGDAPDHPWQRGLKAVSIGVALAGLAVGVWGLVRSARRRERSWIPGAIGAMLVGVTLAGLAFGLADQPQLLGSRMVWTLVVTYLLMAALFESFLHPFVIMFTIPLAIVGGFAGLRLVHDITSADPTIAPQQLDTLTMLGFVILVGVVVNNAILLVYQSLNYMKGVEASDEMPDITPEHPLPMKEAVAESVRTRIRPIMMTALTSVVGTLPLALFPGAGSELYRGIGAVTIGGVLVSTVFTLVLIPLLFSMTMEMSDSFHRLVARDKSASSPTLRPRSRTHRRDDADEPDDVREAATVS